MIALRPALKDYLTMRRALGYKLQRTEKLLVDFIGFVEASASERVTIDLALAWATLPAQGAMNWWAGRLTVVYTGAELDGVAPVWSDTGKERRRAVRAELGINGWKRQGLPTVVMGKRSETEARVMLDDRDFDHDERFMFRRAHAVRRIMQGVLPASAGGDRHC